MYHHHTDCSRLATGLLTVLLAAALPRIATALPDAPDSEESDQEEALYIGYLNADRSADTIYGRLGHGARYRPTHIAWGALDAPGVATTRFLYPDWHTVAVSISVGNMNADTLADMIFYLWGRSESDDMAETRSASLVICGSPRADTIGVIDLGFTENGSSRPPGIVSILPGSHLVEPAIRDYSGVASYVRLPLPAVMPEAPILEPGESAVLAPQVRLHPNPADGRVEINGSGLTPGPCTVVTLDLEGRQIRSEPGTTGADGRLLMTLDIGALPSGYYIVRIDDGVRAVGSLPLLVVH